MGQTKEDNRIGHQVSRAVKSGELIRPDKCEDCFMPGKVSAYHPDTSKPLEVRWLCPDCTESALRGWHLDLVWVKRITQRTPDPTARERYLATVARQAAKTRVRDSQKTIAL